MNNLSSGPDLETMLTALARDYYVEIIEQNTGGYVVVVHKRPYSMQSHEHSGDTILEAVRYAHTVRCSGGA